MNKDNIKVACIFGITSIVIVALILLTWAFKIAVENMQPPCP